MSTNNPVTKVIFERRSIRRFKPDPLSREQIEDILRAGCAAPSGKNRQPWRFIVVQGNEERELMCDAMERGADAYAQFAGEQMLGSTRNTLKAMRSAPVTIIVTAPEVAHPLGAEDNKMGIGDIVNLQSIGAAIQNMLLAAWEQGIGSLWICDTFSGYHELVKHFDLEGLLVAAVSFGIADEAPAARPRKTLEELVTWR